MEQPIREDRSRLWDLSSPEEVEAETIKKAMSPRPNSITTAEHWRQVSMGNHAPICSPPEKICFPA